MKISDVHYSPDPLVEFTELADLLRRYAALSAEFGDAERGDAIVEKTRVALQQGLIDFDALLRHPVPDPDEPETLLEIQAQRPAGVRRLTDTVPLDYIDRWRGSLLGRGAGCTLGAQVEFWSVDQMENWGRQFGDEYPPTDYFPYARTPRRSRYVVGTDSDLVRGQRGFIPADDDTVYTLIGLLTLETYGPEFTKEQQAELWRRNYFPLFENGSWRAYWGERILLQNLEKDIAPAVAGYTRNPNVQSIAAWTRADSWGYAAPGWPEKAAELAFRDSSINHRRNGVYGSMFFAAAVAAGFVVDSPEEALKIALQEVPENSLFAEGVRWAFEVAPTVKDYRDASRLVHERYANMFEGHAINNALYVIFGILIGGRDFTKVVGETVAMGFDNDCTGATSASIVGAVVGEGGVPRHWTDRFENRMQSYLRDTPEFLDLDELSERYLKQANQIAGLSA